MATISLVSAFLHGRTMAVKMGREMSEPRLICGGSPQGSILGNYLFCITTDGLGQDDAGHGPPSQAVQPVNGTPLALRRNRSRVGTDFGRMMTDDGLDGLGITAGTGQEVLTEIRGDLPDLGLGDARGASGGGATDEQDGNVEDVDGLSLIHI